jgi:hypothetical protein
VLVFTYNDVRDRPDWVLDKLRRALALDLASSANVAGSDPSR